MPVGPSISKFIPIISWLPTCSWKTARGDVVAGMLRELVKATGPSLRAVIINPEASPAIDVTCLEMLDRLQGELRELGIDFYFARVADPVRDLFKRSGFVEELEGRLFRGGRLCS
jgi:hypothetical protein